MIYSKSGLYSRRLKLTPEHVNRFQQGKLTLKNDFRLNDNRRRMYKKSKAKITAV